VKTWVHLVASRLHKWLALFAGLQIVLWFASGAYMSFMPIEEVRGEHLVDRNHAQRLPHSIDIQGRGVAVLRSTTERAIRIDVATGAVLPALDASTARAVALDAWKGSKPVSAISHFLTSEPGDFRGDLPVWQVRLSDPDETRVYVSPESGKILAVRTQGWRLFDLMWGLHIMDWNGRENTNSPWLFAFAALSLFLALAGMTLLVLRWPLGRGRRRRG
jgi:hypothetical protein